MRPRQSGTGEEDHGTTFIIARHGGRHYGLCIGAWSKNVLQTWYAIAPAAMTASVPAEGSGWVKIVSAINQMDAATNAPRVHG